jgi:hypothetical protein
VGLQAILEVPALAVRNRALGRMRRHQQRADHQGALSRSDVCGTDPLLAWGTRRAPGSGVSMERRTPNCKRSRPTSGDASSGKIGAHLNPHG